MLAQANMPSSKVANQVPIDGDRRTKARAKRKAAFDPNDEGDSGPSPEPSDLVRAGQTSSLKRNAATQFVLNEQARAALRRLGQTPDPQLDPKRVLLDNVESAWRQRQVWEQMLQQVPDEDWAQVGQTPIPGVLSTAKGQRIEVIQKFLSEATKVSMRSSKLAIDAGIEERLVRLAEEQSALIADTVRSGIAAGLAVLIRLGMISEAEQATALDAAISSAATHLRQLASGEVPSNANHSTPEIYDGIAKEVRSA